MSRGRTSVHPPRPQIVLTSLLHLGLSSHRSSPIMPSSNEPKKHFTTSDIPSLAGLTALVTGGNGGIGLETVKQLSLHGAKVYMASRSQEKGEKAIEELKKSEGEKELDLHFVRVDLSDLQSVRDGARDFARREEKLDILVCNAGVMVSEGAGVMSRRYDSS